MAEKTRVTVRINDADYPIAGDEPAEYIHRLAIYVDEKIRAIKKNNQYLTSSEVPVLTALNIADDFFKARELAIARKKEVENLEQETDRLKDLESEVSKLKEESEVKEEIIEELKSELAKYKT